MQEKKEHNHLSGMKITSEDGREYLNGDQVKELKEYFIWEQLCPQRHILDSLGYNKRSRKYDL